MSQNPAFDSSIPVLTEVVLEPSSGLVELAPSGGTVAAPRTDGVKEGQAVTRADEGDWDTLGQRIAERVLAQLQPQVDALVRSALASAADQIHVGLRLAVEQAVAQQVAAEQFGQK